MATILLHTKCTFKTLDIVWIWIAEKIAFNSDQLLFDVLVDEFGTSSAAECDSRQICRKKRNFHMECLMQC